MSAAAIIAIAIAAVVILAALAFVTLARRSDVRGAGALSAETRRRDAVARETRPVDEVVDHAPTRQEAERAGELARYGTARRHRPRDRDRPVVAARSRGHRRQPAAVLQPRHRHADGAGIGAFSAASHGRLPVADGHRRLRPARSTLGKLDDIKQGISDGQGFFYAPSARAWITAYPADALPKARAIYPAEHPVRHAAGRHRGPLPEVPAPRLPRAVSASPASGSSARATARSTTRSARRRPARRHVAWTASRSRSPATATCRSTPRIRHRAGPGDRHEHDRPGGRGPALHHRWRGALMGAMAAVIALATTSIAWIIFAIIARRLDRLLLPQQRLVAQGGRLGDRAGAQPQALLLRRGAGGEAPRARPAVRRAAAGRDRDRPAAVLGVRARSPGRRDGGHPEAPRRVGIATVRADRGRRLQLRRLPRRHEGRRRHRARTR